MFWLFESPVVNYAIAAVAFNVLVFPYANIFVTLFHQLGTEIAGMLKIPNEGISYMFVFIGGAGLVLLGEKLYDKGHSLLGAFIGVAGLYSIFASVLAYVIPMMRNLSENFKKQFSGWENVVTVF